MTSAHAFCEVPPTVLVVDDNPDMVDLLCRFLSKKGMVVLPAYSGQQCLEEAQHNTVDAIVLDVVMAGMDGLEVCATLKKLETTRAIPIIILTAQDDMTTYLTAMKLGVSEFVVKPARIQDVFARIQTHVECGRKMREMERAFACETLSSVCSGDVPRYGDQAEEGRENISWSGKGSLLFSKRPAS
jgi:DNA-binding response OmpR family regulator